MKILKVAKKGDFEKNKKLRKENFTKNAHFGQKLMKLAEELSRDLYPKQEGAREKQKCIQKSDSYDFNEIQPNISLANSPENIDNHDSIGNKFM